MPHSAAASMPEDTARRRDRLIEIIKTRSFQSGKEVTLASGRTSTYYFNMKPTMLDAEGAHLIATLILDSINDLDADLIGGLEMGAVPIAAAVASGYSGPRIGKTITNIGMNNAAPPMPLSIAVVAMQIETGNMNQ